MPVSVGEIEAVLTARDNMSPAVVAAAQQLKQLNAMLLQIVDDGSPKAAAAIAKLNTAIETAEANFTKLRDSAAAAAAGLSATGDAGSTSATGIGAAGAAAGTSAAQLQQLQQVTQNATAAAQAQATAVTAAAGANTAAVGAIQAATGAVQTQTAAVQAGTTSIGQFESMAERMVARLLVLAAVRGAFNFVEGIFSSADALVKLNVQMDLSLGKLQEVQQIAAKVDVPFATATTAIDTFQKKLGEAKATTADALASIGLSFSALSDMSADQRLDAVIAAIAALPTHLQRVAAEAKLFGTDAIDPLVEKFASLTKEVKDNGTVLEDNAVKALSNSMRAFKDYGTEIQSTAARIIVSLQGVAAGFFSLFTGGDASGILQKNLMDLNKNFNMSGMMDVLAVMHQAPAVANAGASALNGPSTLAQTIRNAFPGAGLAMDAAALYTAPLPKPVPLPDSSGSDGTGGPLTGQAYIDQLREQSNATKQLTEEQRSQLVVLKELNLLDAEHAVHISNNADGTQFTTDQLKEYIKTQKDAVSSGKEYARSEQQLQEILSKAAADLSKLQGENKATGSLQERVAAIDDETYAAQVAAQKRIGFTKDEWEAEYAIYLVGEQKKQSLIDSSSKVEAEILAKAGQDRAAIIAKSAAGSLDARVAAVDMEVYHEQQVAQRRLNNDEESWRTDYAIWLTGEARKQALIDDYGERELKAEKKLRDDLLAAQTVSGAVGLQKILDGLDARAKAEIDALDTSKLRMADYFTQVNIIQDTLSQLRLNAAIKWQQDIDKAIIDVNKQDQDVLINLYMVGLQRELAVNETKREAKLATLKLEGKDTADMITAENKLYDDQARAIITSRDPILSAYRDLNTDLRNQFATTWEQALNGSKSFGQAFSDTLTQDMAKPFERILAGMLADFEQILFSPLLNALRSLAVQAETSLVNALVGGATSGALGGSGGGGTNVYSSLLNQGVQYGEKAAFNYLLGGGGSALAAGELTPGVFSLSAGTSASGAAAAGGGSAGLAGAAPALGTVGGYAGAAVLAWELGKYLGNKTESKTEGTLMGAGAGAAAGAPFAGMTYGLSIPVGAVVGAIAGYIQAGHLYEQTKQDQADLVKQFGSTENEIQAVSKAYELMGYSGEEAQAALHKVWDASTPEEFYKAMQPVAAALQAFKQNTEDLAAATTDAWGRTSDAMLRILDLNTRVGSDTSATLAFLSSQSTVVTGGSSAAVAGLPLDLWDKIYAGTISDGPDSSAEDNFKVLQGKIDDAQKKYNDMVKAGKSTPAQLAAQQSKIDIANRNYNDVALYADPDSAMAAQKAEATKNAPELASLGAGVVGAYAAEVGTGKSAGEALKDNSAALTNLQKAYKDLGIDVTDVALKALFMQNTILTGNPNLIAGVDGLAKEMVGLDNLHLETADSFKEQQDIGTAAYTRIQAAVAAAGGTTKDALLPMQGYLHAAQDEAKKLNVPLDRMTQQMIDQSQDAGIWVDSVTPPPTVQDAIGKLVQAVQDLIDKLNGVPKKINVDIGATGPDGKPIGTGPDPDPTGPTGPHKDPGGPTGPVLMAAGGFGTVSGPTLFLAGEDGNEQFAFSGTNREFPSTMSMDGSANPSIWVAPGKGGLNGGYNPGDPPPTFPFPSPMPGTGGVYKPGDPPPIIDFPLPDSKTPKFPGAAVGIGDGTVTSAGSVLRQFNINLNPVIKLTSDDTKDPARVVSIIGNEILTDQNGLRTLLEQLAVKALNDAR